MKKSTQILALIFLIFIQSVKGYCNPINDVNIKFELKQDSNKRKHVDLSSRGGAGLHFGRILGQTGNFQGIEATMGKFRYLSINNNNVVTSNYFDNNVDTTRKIQSLSFCLPIKKLGFGNRFKGISGYSIIPKVGIGLAQKIDGNIKKNGLSAMAGLTLHLPYCMVEAGIDANYVGLNKNSGGKQTLIYPHISFKFDALFEILGLSLSKTENEVTVSCSKTSISNYQNVKNLSGDVIGHSWTETTTTWDEQQTRVLFRITTDPFWYIGPRYSYVGSNASVNQNMYGLSTGYRIAGLGIDAFVETGNIAYKGNKKKSYLHNPFPENQEAEVNDPTFLASGSGTMLIARISMDPVLLIRTSRGAVTDGKPGAMRFLVGGGIGYSFLGKPKFLNTYANAVKDAEFIAEPDLWESPSNDARLSKSGVVYNFFASLELGAIGFEVSQYIFNKYKAPLAVGLFKTITYAIPIKQTKNAYKNLKKSKREVNEKI